MENPHPPADATSATYEIRLQGTLPKTLRRSLPEAKVCTTRAETVLFRRIENPAELDSLLDALMSMGLVLTDIHEVPLTDGSMTDSLTHGRRSTQEGQASGNDEGV